MPRTNSLVSALKKWFDKPLHELPEDLRQRVKQEFFPVQWDKLSPEQRRTVAFSCQCKEEEDETRDEDAKAWFEHYASIDDLERDIREWQSVATPTATDLEKQKNNLAELNEQLSAMQEQAYPDPRFSKTKQSNNMQSNSDAHPLVKFQSMKNLKFKEIKIRIDPEQMMLRVSARNEAAIVPLSALGLTRRNQITPNQQGETFMAMADGHFYPEKKGAMKSLHRLSKSLRSAFNTEDIPFTKCKPNFWLSIPKDERAKQRAERKTITYGLDVASFSPASSDVAEDIVEDVAEDDVENDPASDFFRHNDPNWDPNDPTYADDPDFGLRKVSKKPR